MDKATVQIITNALILAYIKCKQSKAFDQVDGFKCPDMQAEKQILDAIHIMEPGYEYQESYNTL